MAWLVCVGEEIKQQEEKKQIHRRFLSDFTLSEPYTQSCIPNKTNNMSRLQNVREPTTEPVAPDAPSSSTSTAASSNPASSNPASSNPASSTSTKVETAKALLLVKQEEKKLRDLVSKTQTSGSVVFSSTRRKTQAVQAHAARASALTKQRESLSKAVDRLRKSLQAHFEALEEAANTSSEVSEIVEENPETSYVVRPAKKLKEGYQLVKVGDKWRCVEVDIRVPLSCLAIGTDGRLKEASTRFQPTNEDTARRLLETAEPFLKKLLEKFLALDPDKPPIEKGEKELILPFIKSKKEKEREATPEELKKQLAEFKELTEEAPEYTSVVVFRAKRGETSIVYMRSDQISLQRLTRCEHVACLELGVDYVYIDRYAGLDFEVPDKMKRKGKKRKRNTEPGEKMTVNSAIRGAFRKATETSKRALAASIIQNCLKYKLARLSRFNKTEQLHNKMKWAYQGYMPDDDKQYQRVSRTVEREVLKKRPNCLIEDTSYPITEEVIKMADKYWGLMPADYRIALRVVVDNDPQLKQWWGPKKERPQSVRDFMLNVFRLRKGEPSPADIVRKFIPLAKTDDVTGVWLYAHTNLKLNWDSSVPASVSEVTGQNDDEPAGVGGGRSTSKRPHGNEASSSSSSSSGPIRTGYAVRPITPEDIEHKKAVAVAAGSFRQDEPAGVGGGRSTSTADTNVGNPIPKIPSGGNERVRQEDYVNNSEEDKEDDAEEEAAETSWMNENQQAVSECLKENTTEDETLTIANLEGMVSLLKNAGFPLLGKCLDALGAPTKPKSTNGRRAAVLKEIA